MRLIDADAWLEYLSIGDEKSREENVAEIVTAEDIDAIPTVTDVEPVRHERLIRDGDTWKCAGCGSKADHKANYCSRCGAKFNKED